MRTAIAFAVVFLLASPDIRAQEPPERRTALDGTVVLEDAPEVPDRVVDALNRYQNVRSAGLIDWTADGRGIYVGTRFADVTQIHRVDLPG
ncbi:MAG TPA: S9 family peptidase, partial [Gemmatimonadota bacterium]|nr:S9 family peptidase [Gemmatimonadota bacterium]